MTCENPSVWKAKLLLTCKIALISVLGVILAALPANTYADDMVVNAKNSLEWNRKEAFYHAIGNAEAIQGKQKIRADSLKAFYDPETVERTITRIIADEVSTTDIKINAMDPGWTRTDMGGESANRTPDIAAQTVVWLATLASSGPSGKFFRDKKEIEW